MASILDRLKIRPKGESRRLVFVRQSRVGLWHLADVSINRAMPDNSIEFMALHGKYIHPIEQVDTVVGASPRIATDGFCARCLDEYHLALPMIQKHGLLRFE
jgi:hypothetical protein